MKATVDLQEAEPIAASATSADGQWNALMTTLNEVGQVGEGHLIAALQAQCTVTNSNTTNFEGLGPRDGSPAGLASPNRS